MKYPCIINYVVIKCMIVVSTITITFMLDIISSIYIIKTQRPYVVCMSAAVIIQCHCVINKQISK